MDTSDVVRLLNDYYSVANTLRRRGFEVGRSDPMEQVLSESATFYEHMKSFTYRKVLRRIGKHDMIDRNILHSEFADLTESGLDGKLTQMKADGVVDMDGERYGLPNGKDYGTSFEWFVAEVFRREMSGVASFGVKLLTLKTGGDYDVIARLEDLLVFAECKTGSFDARDIELFVRRSDELVPDLALFVLDSNGLPNDFDKRCYAVDRPGLGFRSKLVARRRRAAGRGLFHELNARSYVVTSEGKLVKNIILAVNHYVRFIRPYGLIGPGPKGIAVHYDEYED
jgi:hypothetical protein